MALYEGTDQRKRLSGQLMFVGVWLAITAVAVVLHPDSSGHGTHTQLGLPPCPSVLLFSRPCPGCGLTTSFTALLHGDLALAFRAHAFGPLLYLGTTLWAALCGYGWLKGLRLDGGGRTFNRVMAGLMIVFFVFGIGRMILSPGFAASPEEKFVSKIVSDL
jgi:hypothetical protein